MSEEAKGVEVLDAPVTVVEVKPTVAEAIEVGGLSPAEAEMAEKHNLVKTEGTEKKVELKVVKDEAKADDEPAPATVEEMAADPKAQAAVIDPVKEAELLKGFDHKGKGLYWKMKSETLRRQAAETEREHTEIKLKASQERAKKLEEELKAEKEGKKTSVKTESKKDAFGNDIEEEVKDESDKPLTKKDLDDIEKSKQEKLDADAKVQEENNARAKVLVETLNSQEAAAKARYDDFDEVCKLTDVITKNIRTIETIIPDPKLANKARALAQLFFHATHNADKIKTGDYDAADIAYELGQLHPDYKPNGAGKSSKADGGLNPEKAKKIEANLSKRGSSAALAAGGGKRFVPYEEITLEVLESMSSADYAKVPKEVRQRVLRGE